MKKTTKAVTPNIALQSWLRPALTVVGANKDYAEFRQLLESVDSLLRGSHLEAMALDFAKEGAGEVSFVQLRNRMDFGLKALRFEVLRMLLGNMSFRKLSRNIAASDLLADFCGVRTLEGIHGVSKSVLERAAKFFTAEQVRWMGQVFVEMCGEPDRASELGLSAVLATDVCLVDGTCLETNIHFPVDWVLLRDVSKTLLKAMILIRRAGLRHRMPEEPECFARQMNKLCMAMTHARRRSDPKRARKQILRQMKHLLRTIGEHARRHRDLLEHKHSQTPYSQRQAKQIIARIDAMLGQLGAVIKQAHERLIGERSVANEVKILSVHERDVNVLVRGKAGRNVEFGNSLLLSEASSGLITDWQLYQGAAPAEWRQLEESLARQNRFDLSAPISAVGTDRGFATKKTAAILKQQDIYDAVCPRNPRELTERLSEKRFAQLQRRRSATEARIAIIKQRHGGRLRCKGFANRYRSVGWSVIGHNLWLVSRLLAEEIILKRAA